MKSPHNPTDQLPLDYRRLLFAILDCFSQYEGTWYDSHWEEFGVSREEEDRIKTEYAAWLKEQETN